MAGHIECTSRRLLLACAALAASAGMVLGTPTGPASAEPEPNPSCFGIPECTIPGFLGPTGKGGGGYANGTAGGAYSRGEAGGGYATGDAGGAWNHAD